MIVEPERFTERPPFVFPGFDFFKHEAIIISGLYLQELQSPEVILIKLDEVCRNKKSLTVIVFFFFFFYLQVNVILSF